MVQDNTNQILLYEAEDGETHVEVLYEGETVWLTQKQMAELFDKDVKTINEHIRNIYKEGELEKEATIWKFQIVQQEGSRQVKRNIDHYNLDMIISVGYRVNSQRGTRFRIWATKTLREYIIKGFVVDDERLENGGSNYFDELYERVRRIRTSERNFYLKVLDIFSTSIDYDSKSQDAKTFFATVQNKFHYAIHGNTAAELITQRVGRLQEHLGLTSWSGTIVKKKDAVVAKNYLTALELRQLELLVEQFLSYAELQVVEKRPMYMADWIRELDRFIVFNRKEILNSAGKVSRREMEQKVREELSAYRERIMKTEKLKADEFEKMLDSEAQHLLTAPEDISD